MLKVFSILLSIFILIQSFGINISNLTQVGEFIEHAQYHNEKYGDNIFQFVSKHYGELKNEHNKQHQEEKEDHEQLPFQDFSFSFSMQAFVLNINTQDLKTVKVKSFHFHYQNPISTLHLDRLFKPPRFS